MWKINYDIQPEMPYTIEQVGFILNEIVTLQERIKELTAENESLKESVEFWQEQSQQWQDMANDYSGMNWEGHYNDRYGEDEK